MKKSILLIVAFFVNSQASWAQNSVDVFGEVDINGTFINLPTGDRGSSEISIPGLFLNVMAPLSEDNFLMLRFEGSQNNFNMISTSTNVASDSGIISQNRFSVRVREAYLDLVSLFQGLHGFRVGLVPQLWQEVQYDTWPYRFLGTNAWVITEKWKYLTQADLGFSYMSDLPQDYGDWALTVTSGQGAQEQEKSPYKDVSLLTRIRYWDDWMLSLAYTRGVYQDYGPVLGAKERISGMITYEPSKDWTFGLELLRTQDPSEAIVAYEMAEGVYLSGKESIRGFGGSLFGIVAAGMKAEVMIRYDYLNAAMGQSGKSMQTGMAAWGYQLTEDVKWSLAVDYTTYGVDYGQGSNKRDSSKVELGAQVLF